MSTEYTFKLALTAAIQELVEGGLLKLGVVTSINSNIILSLDVFSSKGSNMHVSIAVVVFFFIFLLGRLFLMALLLIL